MQNDNRHVFICHAEEDSGVAIQLATTLEERGFSTWYYERDTIPGLSYLEQSVRAIETARSFVMLVSTHSMQSNEVDKEIFQAHRTGRPFLPALIDVSQSDLQAKRPTWATMIGAAASIDLRSDDFPSIVSRISRGIEEVSGRVVSDQPTKANSLGDALISNAWVSDAHQIDVHDLEKVVFRNSLIDDFLVSHTKFFLSASKGLGKTLLLTYKRSLLSDGYTGEKPKGSLANVRFVPEGKPYLDFMSDLQCISKEKTLFLSDLISAKRLWSFALKVSALSYNSHLLAAGDEQDLSDFPRRLGSWLQGSRVEPTLVFKELLSRPVSEINRIIDQTENFLEYKFRQIHSGIFVFVDKVDQAIRNLPRAAWIHIQAGLVEAAWDAMNANRHVKVFAAIRQEAFSNYESDIKVNLFGAVTIIEYTEADLIELLDQLTQCYEGKRTFKQFIRLNTVRHDTMGVCEDAFKYLHRHALGRPRDLVIIASKLSSIQNQMSGLLYRSEVCDASSTVVVANIFNEMKVFLDSLRDGEQRLRLWSLIPRNILTMDDLVHICAEFNGIDAETLRMMGLDSNELHHPFWELYNTGLLGIVDRKLDGQGALQRFKRPHDIAQQGQTDLPKVDFYVIHPALTTLISKHRKSMGFTMSRYVLVGQRYPWEDYFGPLLQVEWQLLSVPQGELKATAEDMLNIVTQHLASGRSAELTDTIVDSPRWNQLRERLEQQGHDTLWLWLEELALSEPRPRTNATSLL